MALEVFVKVRAPRHERVNQPQLPELQTGYRPWACKVRDAVRAGQYFTLESSIL